LSHACDYCLTYDKCHIDVTIVTTCAYVWAYAAVTQPCVSVTAALALHTPHL